MNAESHYDYTRTVLPKPLLQRFAKQIAMGIFCSVIAGAIYRSADLMKVSRFIASAFIHITGGDPIKNGLDAKIPKIGRLPLPVPAHMPTLHKTPEQLETEARLKEEKEKREHESKRKTVIAELESMGVEFDREATLEKLLVVLQEEKAKREDESRRMAIIAELEAMGGRFDLEASLEKLQVELKEAKDMQRKRPLLERADKMELSVDPKEPYAILEKRVHEAEVDAEFQEQVREYERRLAAREQLIETGPNARCVNPRCRYQFRTKKKVGDYRCPRCRVMSTFGQARACWTPPPMPPPPKHPKPGMMDRMKKFFKG